MMMRVDHIPNRLQRPSAPATAASTMSTPPRPRLARPVTSAAPGPGTSGEVAQRHSYVDQHDDVGDGHLHRCRVVKPLVGTLPMLKQPQDNNKGAEDFSTRLGCSCSL